MRKFDVSPVSDLDPELGILVSTWQDGTREWRDGLGLPETEALVWQPYENGPSIGGILLHMISCDNYWLLECAQGQPVDPSHPAVAYDRTMDQYVPHWPVPPAQTIEWYFDQFDRNREKMIASIVAHNQPNSEHPRKDYLVSYRWILAHILEHDSYHGGQTVLLHEMYKKR